MQKVMHKCDVQPGWKFSNCPLALTQASVKTSWASKSLRHFVAFIKDTQTLVSAVGIKFPSLIYSQLSLSNGHRCKTDTSMKNNWHWSSMSFFSQHCILTLYN